MKLTKIFIIFLGSIVIPLLVYAEGQGGFDPMRPPDELGPLVTWIFWYALIISGFILVGVLVAAGFKFLFAGGDPNRVKDARDQLTQGVLGVLILLTAFTILHTINPELVLDGMIVKPDVIFEPRVAKESGVHFCYEMKPNHYEAKQNHFYRPDLNFKCKNLVRSEIGENQVLPVPPEIIKRDIARYGKVQEYLVWECKPQIRHQEKWRNICYNHAETWLELLPFEAYLFPDPLDKIEDDPGVEGSMPTIEKSETLKHGCRKLVGGGCALLTDLKNKCYIITKIQIFTPRYQCTRFHSSVYVEQIDNKEFTHYRIVKEREGYNIIPSEEVDFGIIFHEKFNFEGRCFFYQSPPPPERYRGKVHGIDTSFLYYKEKPLTYIRKNFRSVSIIRIEEREYNYKGRVTLYEGIDFVEPYESRDLPYGDGYNRVRKHNIKDQLKNNIRSIRIEEKVDEEEGEPMIAILFSGVGTKEYPSNVGFCELFMACDHSLEDNRIGQDRIIDPGPFVPIRLPWLFYAPTAESIIVISGTRI